MLNYLIMVKAMGNLTNKQEAFAIKYAECGNATEAYRHAYSTKNMKPSTIENNAYMLTKNSEVAARIGELKSKARELAEEKYGCTIESLIKELEEARGAALGAETVQASAAVNATMSKAKLCGFDVKKVDLTSSDGSMSNRRTKLDDFYSD